MNGDQGSAAALPPRTLLALIVGQVCLHACMAGLRVAAPLAMLDRGASAFAVGTLLALFAVSAIGLALPAGRLADRRGYHAPLHLAVAMTFGGALLATLLPRHYAALGVAGLLVGGGANVGLICIQRTAGRMAQDATERMRVFSWLGLAPALANMIGPVVTGVAIDLGSYRAAFGVLALLPLVALAVSRLVPREAPLSVPQVGGRRPAAWDLLRSAALRRLLVVNWLLSASWDLHSFVLPVLGHARGLGASTIGIILGLFAGAVATVRLAVPLLAHRLRESQVLVGAMLATAGVFCLYPFTRNAVSMAACAVLLGLALGAVQPMVLSTLHAVTPHDRHGEAIGIRSMTINLSSTVMPLAFGAAGASLGAAALFWLMGAAVAAGSWQARRLGAAMGGEPR